MHEGSKMIISKLPIVPLLYEGDIHIVSLSERYEPIPCV